jgi:hypothetical protein
LGKQKQKEKEKEGIFFSADTITKEICYIVEE